MSIEESLTKLTSKLLDTLQEQPKNFQQRIEQLKTAINFHDRKYYQESVSLISDYEYDQLFKQLTDLEERFPEFRTADSPTQRVSRGLTDSFETVSHLSPMLSLDNSYNAEDLGEYDRRVHELTERENVEYAVEPKYDGSSISLVYENDMLVRAATRGDGSKGDDITNNAKVIKSIPLSAAFSQLGIHTAEVRGEVVIENTVFSKMNEAREQEGLKLFQNSRNTASGGLRMKDSAEVSKRGLEAFIYQIALAKDVEGNDVLTSKLEKHSSSIDFLEEIGFKVPPRNSGRKVCKNIAEVVDFCLSWEEKRNGYNYEIDGMVVKIDHYELQQLTGSTAHHPRWAIAYKFKARKAQTKILHIDFQVGRTGAITPVAKLEPVPLAGVTISSVSLHNEDFIREKDLHEGDTVVVERAGDVIPYISGVVAEKRAHDAKPFQFLTNCPSCDSALFKTEDEAAWRCPNVECPAQSEERIIHFVSKGAMDIDGLGKDIVRRFMQEGIIANIHDLYRDDLCEKVLALEGWKEKSVENLREGIEKSKNQPIWRLLVGLGIRHIGSTTAKMIASKIGSLIELKDWTGEQLIELEDVGPKVAEAITEFFSNESNLELLNALENSGVKLRKTAEETQKASDVLAGLKFLFTGTLTQFGRDRAKELVEDHGGTVISSVSKKLDYLVAGEKAGSKLAKAQKIETIKIISEQDFLDLIGGTD